LFGRGAWQIHSLHVSSRWDWEKANCGWIPSKVSSIVSRIAIAGAARQSREEQRPPEPQFAERFGLVWDAVRTLRQNLDG